MMRTYDGAMTGKLVQWRYKVSIISCRTYGKGLAYFCRGYCNCGEAAVKLR